jgi:hypothetical protein
MSLSLEFYYYPTHAGFKPGESTWWIGNTQYQVLLPDVRAMQRLWRKHVPGTRLRVLQTGPNYRILALPKAISKMKRSAFLAELLTKCKKGELPWPFHEPAAT